MIRSDNNYCFIKTAFRTTNARRYFLFIFIFLFFTTPVFAQNESQTKEQTFSPHLWRFEMNGGTGFFERGWENCLGDVFGGISIERTLLHRGRGEFGIRGYPVWLYSKKGDERIKSDLVYAAALGIVTRGYLNRETKKGLFGEIAVSTMWNSDHFKNNGSNINFFMEFGIGYQFDSNWHIIGKFQHISNGNIDSQNDGLNMLALGMGYYF